MCVILTAEKSRLTDTMIAQAIDRNPDGNGLAWIEDGAVHFRKGLTIDEAQELARVVPLPYVFHARIATIGGIRPELCHPFPLDRRVKATALAGRSTKGVLFHNGHWHAWDEHVDQGAGPWSDSRAMAELVAAHGPDAIDDCVGETQRVVLLTREGVQRFGAGWSSPARGVWASNRLWLVEACAYTAKSLPSSWRAILHGNTQHGPVRDAQQQLLLDGRAIDAPKKGKPAKGKKGGAR